MERPISRDTMLDTHSCFQSQCPIQFILDMLGGKWSLLILRQLWEQDCRTHELLTALPGISSKTLTAKLRNLEEHGIVARRAYPEIPPRVEYAITPKGKELEPVFLALYQVGQQWLHREDCLCPITGNSEITTAAEQSS